MKRSLTILFALTLTHSLFSPLTAQQTAADAIIVRVYDFAGIQQTRLRAPSRKPTTSSPAPTSVLPGSTAPWTRSGDWPIRSATR